MRKDFHLRAGRHTVTLGSWDGDSFAPLAFQSPGMVSPLLQADAMMLTKPEKSTLQKGESVRILPIKWDISSEREKEIFNQE